MKIKTSITTDIDVEISLPHYTKNSLGLYRLSEINGEIIAHKILMSCSYPELGVTAEGNVLRPGNEPATEAEWLEAKKQAFRYVKTEL